MVTILSWNFRQKPLLDEVAGWCMDRSVDIIIATEAAFSLVELNHALRRVGGPDFFEPAQNPGSKGPRIFSRIATSHRFLFASPDFLAHRVTVQGATAFTLVAVHLPSKLKLSSADQKSHAQTVVGEIRQIEAMAGDRMTLVAGDFNMDPYEPGMLDATCFHAMPTRQLASRETRKVKGRTYEFFYNPTWCLFGDLSGPPGTYYYDDSRYEQAYWHVFDQVIVRPPAMGGIDTALITVLDRTSSGQSLLANRSGTPVASYSDHLPLIFKFNPGAI